MHIIKLNAIDSTNTYLRKLCNKAVIKDYTVVSARLQNKGRGQIGTSWESQEGKNLTCSVFKVIRGISTDQNFYISMVTSLAIITTLQRFNIPKLRVKWPNDILSEDKKICGILIENIIKNTTLEASIIGIGLNVNQTEFDNLPLASSLKNITGQLFDIDELILTIVQNLKLYFNRLKTGENEAIKHEYETLLFRKDKPSTFKDQDGLLFPGFIKGIDASGNLTVLLEDEIIKTFKLKEIQLLF